MAPFFSEGVAGQLFIPFIDSAIKNFGYNPWEITSIENFPYGAVLFAVVFVPKALFATVLGDSVLGTGFLGMLLFKLPLLLFDFVLLLLICLLANNQSHRVLIFYWLNPVLIFISYVHGQLDIVSMTFIVASLISLKRGRVASSGLLFGLSLGSKFHVLVCAPFLLAYIWNTEFRKEAFFK
ncbi:MAG: hypothetical protein N2578_09385, partial [Bdellovibrionaceae bacterium]|nr:hypothetical protein [Pseudobdellovibrionaceae bacterium]